MRYIYVLLLVILSYSAVYAAEYDKDLNEVAATDMKGWAYDDIVINALKKSNEKNADISITDRKILDNKWQGEKRKNKQSLINSVMGNELSEYLKEIHKDGEGIYTEIIVIDMFGINVGQSRISGNYWQGQQDKWVKTYKDRSYANYIGDLHFDDNTELFQVELSFMIIIEDEPIGVVYAGIDVEQIEDWRRRKEEAF